MAFIAMGLVLGVVWLPSSGRTTAVSNKDNQAVRSESTVAVTRTAITRDNKIVTKTEGGPPETEFIPGEVLVKFRRRVDANTLRQSQNAKTNLSLASSPQLTSVFKQFRVNRVVQPFEFTRSTSLRAVLKLTAESLRNDHEKTKELLAELRSQPEVEYAELNLIMRAQVAPDDPYYSSSGAWGQGFRDLWGLQKVSAESAWNTSTGSNIIVAVSDSGVDYNHEDIAGNIWQNPGETGTDSQSQDKKTNGIDDDNNGFVDDWHGWDFVTIDGTPADNDPMDDHGHGTHVAGTIAATGNNGKGIIGVAHAARIMPLKGLHAVRGGSAEDLTKTILYAADNGATVINASWGGFSTAPVQTFIDAIAYAHDTKGVVFVAAAGNSNFDVGTPSFGFTPANIRNVITVSASDHTDDKASFSNFGLKVDVAAPGGGDTDPTSTIFSPSASILSLLSSEAQTGTTSSGQLVIGGNYLRIAGTSMAAPHVAGVAALVRALNPGFSPEQVRQALRLGSDDVDTPGFDINSGHGRINASRALTISAPLAAQLTGPLTTVTDTCMVELRGTAAGPGFSNWALEFAAASNPNNWIPITTSTVQVNSGLLTTWNTSTLADGIYTIRLVARNSSDQLFEDRLPIKIDNVFITDPSLTGPFSVSSPPFRGGEAITIKGTAGGCAFASYIIKIRRASDGQLLTTPAINLTNGGLQRVSQNVLGTWDTTDLAADYYQIILEVRHTDGSVFEKTTRVIVDPTLHPGWPKNLGLVGAGFFLAITDHIDAADVDGDGDKELIIGYGHEVRIFDDAGNQLPGWPQSIDPLEQGAHIQVSPAVGDLDGDGKPEIVAASTGDPSQIFIWRANGTLLPGWPRSMGGTHDSVAIDDINNDQVNEVITTDWFGGVRVFNKDGQFLTGWPQIVVASIAVMSPPSIADLDRDGNKEIVVKDIFNGDLYVLSSNGTILPGWPKRVATGLTFTYQAIGDLTGDHRLEIVAPSNDGKVYVFNSDGTDAPGWPQLTNATVLNSPAIGDIDLDGKSEVVVAGYNDSTRVDYLYVWRGNGVLLPNWPVTGDDPFSSGFGAPAVADISGDGIADVVVSANLVAGATPLNGPSALQAFGYDGSRVTGFPKETGSVSAFQTNTVAVANLDNDGLLEMAWIDRDANLWVWDLPSPASATLPWAMFHHDARHTGTNFLAPGAVQFNASTATVTETPNATTVVNLSVTRTGDHSASASIDYATSDGSASDRSDYLPALGRLHFAPAESSKTITIFVVDDRFGENPETFNVTLSNPGGCTLGSPSTFSVTILSNEVVNGLNPVKNAGFDTDFFVRQQYLDFFSREADAGGLVFWKNQIDECATQSCREIRRINVSAAFFVSGEFQQTGYLVYKSSQAAFNSGEFLKLRDFLPDTQEIGRGVVIGQPGADAQLEANKVRFFSDFVQRAKFTEPANYPTSMTAAEFVDKLNANTFDPLNTSSGGALTQTQRDALVAQLEPNPSSATLRAQVLRSITQNSLFSSRQLNKAFVLMQYFGYLRRNPNDSPEIGLDFGGYTFWLSKLNSFNGNYISAEMVKAFITSGEYQQRFGP